MSRQIKIRAFGLVCATVLMSLAVPSGLAAFVDPLIAPSVASDHVSKSFLVSVTRVPGGPDEMKTQGRWVAVGRRGHILLSADGKTWKQAASVPVSTDLVSVFFVSASHGWAVGHGGVIIATIDGGNHWIKQFDGKQAADALVKFYEPLAANSNNPTKSKNPDIEFSLKDAIRFKESGPGRPFLDIWFADEKHGYAVGAYNLLFVTDDGGNTWQPRPDRIVNEMGLHLNNITAIGNDVYISGEQGLFARLNSVTGKFDRIKTPYPGTFFGLTGKTGLLVLFGLQGNAFRSTDNGTNWKKIEPGLRGTITAGTSMPDGRLVLVSQTGSLALSTDNGDHFTQIKPVALTPIYAIAPGSDDDIVAVGNRGVKTESLHQGKQNGN